MNFLRSGMLALALIAAVPAIAQAQSASTDMQVLANEVKADKKALVAQNMELTATEAESFWPIYDAYQQDLQKINDRMSLMILEYADASSKGTVDDATAKKLLGEALAIREVRIEAPANLHPEARECAPGSQGCPIHPDREQGISRYGALRGGLQYSSGGVTPSPIKRPRALPRCAQTSHRLLIGHDTVRHRGQLPKPGTAISTLLLPQGLQALPRQRSARFICPRG